MTIFNLFYRYFNRHHSNRTNNHQSNPHAAHAHAAAAAHQAVNDALSMPFGGGMMSPFGAFGGLSAFGGMGSPFGAIGGPGKCCKQNKSSRAHLRLLLYY